MSITSIRKMTEKKGCQAVLIVIGVAMALGMVLTYAGRGNQEQEMMAKMNQSFVIEGTVVTPENIEQTADMYATNSQIDRTSPRGDFQALAGALTQMIGKAVVTKMASANMVKVTDDDILKTAEAQVNQQIQQLKMQVASQAKLKPDAKPEQIEQEFTKLVGKSSQAILADQMTQIKEAIKDPAKRTNLESASMAEKLQKVYADKAVFTEDDLKKSYDTYFFEQVAFDTSKASVEDKNKQAELAREELEKGADIKAVRTKYAPESKLTTFELTRQVIDMNPAYKPLMDLKPGEVSEVLDMAPYPTIVKLTKVENKLPADFEKTKASLLTLNKTQKGSADFQKAFTDARNSLKIEWKDQGLKLVWQTVSTLTDPETMMNQSKTLEKLKELESASKLIELTPQTNQRTLTLAQYMISEEILNSTTGEDKQAALDTWLEQIGAVLSYYESIPLRLDATNRLLEAKQNAPAFDMLLEAARANRNFDEQGQGWYTQIDALKEQGKKSSAFSGEQVTQIDKELQQWLTEKVAFDKEEADAKAETEKASKELDEETKAAEKEKAEAEAKKNSADPKTGDDNKAKATGN